MLRLVSGKNKNKQDINFHIKSGRGDQIIELHFIKSVVHSKKLYMQQLFVVQKGSSFKDCLAPIFFSGLSHAYDQFLPFPLKKQEMTRK